MSLRPGMVVLFTSGYSREVIAHRGVLDRDVAYIAKPYLPDELDGEGAGDASVGFQMAFRVNRANSLLQTVAADGDRNCEFARPLGYRDHSGAACLESSSYPGIDGLLLDSSDLLRLLVL